MLFRSGGAGGGLSATTIGVVGAAVAGGAIAANQIANKDGGDATFAGTFTGTITGTLASRGGADVCTYTRAVSAQARLVFKDRSDTAVTGKFDYSGTATVTASTCGNFTVSGPPFIGEVELSGSPSRFSGRSAFPAPSTGGVTGENVYTFEGSISGETASGTFAYEEQSFSPGDGGGSVTQKASGRFTITFTKS